MGVDYPNVVIPCSDFPGLFYPGLVCELDCLQGNWIGTYQKLGILHPWLQGASGKFKVSAQQKSILWVQNTRR